MDKLHPELPLYKLEIWLADMGEADYVAPGRILYERCFYYFNDGVLWVHYDPDDDSKRHLYPLLGIRKLHDERVE